MRTIKFRGKSIINGDWISGCLFVNDDGRAFIVHELITKDTYYSEVIPDSVGQFTSLFDKNEQEIYEGHTVSIGGDIRVIEWHKIGLRAKSIKYNYNFPLHYPFVKSPQTDWEIIGNIYENPELLNPTA